MGYFNLNILESNRSSNYITPSFAVGCLFDCAYCYVSRYKPVGVEYASDVWPILDAIDNHALQLGPKTVPDQTHDKYWSYDFSCNEDFILHAKHHPWEHIFTFFKNHPLAFGTAATKFVNKRLLSFNPNRKIRIRFSLMPQKFADILEPNTSPIIDRIKAINTFYKAGYDVHINYSPVIASKDSKPFYIELFKLVDKYVDDSIKPYVKAEVIFLTHNRKLHVYNIRHNPAAEKLLWRPALQEAKVSQYGGRNIRYKLNYKSTMIAKFSALLKHVLPWQEIRYIF